MQEEQANEVSDARPLSRRETNLEALATAIMVGTINQPEMWGVSMEARELQFLVALEVMATLHNPLPPVQRWRVYEEAATAAGIQGPKSLPVWMRLSSPLSPVPPKDRQEVHTTFLRTWMERVLDSEPKTMPELAIDPLVQVERLYRELRHATERIAYLTTELSRYEPQHAMFVDLSTTSTTELVQEILRLRGACHRAEQDLVKARRAELTRLRSGRQQYDEARRGEQVAEEAAKLAIAGYRVVSRNRDHEYSTDPSMHPDHVELVNTHTGKSELCATFGVGATKGPAGLFVPCSYELTVATPSPRDEVRLPGASTVSLAGVTRFVVLSYGADLAKFTGYDLNDESFESAFRALMEGAPDAGGDDR